MLKIKDKFINCEKYRNRYNQLCKYWRYEPRSQNQRQLNDVFCTVLFICITLLFVTVGIYYIVTVEPDSFDKKTSNQIDKAIANILQDKYFIFFGLFLSIFLSFFYIFLLNVIARFIIYTILLATFAEISIFLYGAMYIKNYLASLLLIAILIVYTIVVIYYRKQIKIGSFLIKIVTKFMLQRKIVFVAVLNKIILLSVFGSFWYYSNYQINLKINQIHRTGQDPYIQKTFSFLWKVLLIYYELIIYYVMVFNISTIFALWYYQIQDSKPLRTSWKWIFKSSFGSICFAALIITVTKFFGMIVDTQKQYKCNIVARGCLKLVSCLFSKTSSLLQFLNHTSIICMAVTGENFVNSAKTAVGVIGEQYALISMFSTLILVWGINICIFIPMIFEGLITGKQIQILGFLAINSGGLLLTILTQCLCCVILFYSIDKRFKQLGYSTHRMPKQFSYFLQKDPPIQNLINRYMQIRT